MIYYALLKGAGKGCSSTIGCNTLYEKLSANTLKDAKKEINELSSGWGGVSREEGWDGWDEIILLECSKEIKKTIPDKEYSDE